LTTLSLSETYNLSKLDAIRAIIEECLVKHGMLKIDSHSSDKGTILESSREGFSLRITLREEKMTREDSRYFQGQPKVKIEIVASSDDDKKLKDLVEEFRYCVLIRAMRAGG